MIRIVKRPGKAKAGTKATPKAIRSLWRWVKRL